MKYIATAILLIVTCASGETLGSWIHVKGDAWDPGETILKEIKGKLQQHTIAQAKRQHVKLPPWDQYRFQYQGRFEGGKRMVFINAFCRTIGDIQLETEMDETLDGGPCFFTVEYDPETKVFHSLTFNGNA